MTTQVFGEVRPGFEAVADEFSRNFEKRDELGAACCIYVDGEKVADLWGGLRDRETRAPWEKDTMVCVFSATKGMSALALALAHSRGLIDYEQRVCTYWPEFAQQGKERITVRQLLSHQAGLFALDAPVDRGVIADLDQLATVLAAQKPEWEPGSRQAYAMIALGFYEGELLRRVDPLHRSLGQYFQDEIATPLGLDFYIRVPAAIPNTRLATINDLNLLRALPILARISLPLLLSGLNPGSALRRSDRNPGSNVVIDPDTVYLREVEVPAGGGVGTARAMARAYSEFATGGHELGLRSETLRALMAPAKPPRHGFYDESLKVTWQLSLGFLKSSPGYWLFGSPDAFGMPGWGGSFAFADPETRLGYAYVMNRVGPHGPADKRDSALRAALNRCLGLKEKAA